VFDPTGNAVVSCPGRSARQSGICVRRRCGLQTLLSSSLFVLNIEDLSTSGLTIGLASLNSE